MISSERTKELFLGCKLYYTSNYDFFRYKGRLKKQPENVESVYVSIANTGQDETGVLPLQNLGGFQ